MHWEGGPAGMMGGAGRSIRLVVNVLFRYRYLQVRRALRVFSPLQVIAARPDSAA
jgi:hypothetical protein